MNLAWPLCPFQRIPTSRASIAFLLLALSSGLAQKISIGDDSVSTPSSSNRSVGAERELPGSSDFEQIEGEAFEFVKMHHPELVSLLQLLKAMREKEYETAIRDIVRIQKRLEALENRDPDAHQTELDAWKVQSKIDLLLAKAFARDKSFNPKSLRSLLKEQIEIQKRRYENEQRNLAKRQELIADQLQKLVGHEEEKVEQQFSTLMKRVDAKVGKPGKSKSESKPSKESKTSP